MKRVAALALLALATATAPAEAQVAPEDLKRFEVAIKRIHDRTLSERHTYALLKDLCAAAPRRLSGSPAAAAAVEWAEQAMTQAGLEKVHLEACMVPHWVRGDVESLRFVAPAEGLGEPLPILALGGTVATPTGGVVAEVIEITDLDQITDAVKGKIVFFNRPFDPTLLSTFKGYSGAGDQRFRGPAKAAAAGAVAAIVRSMTPNLDDIPHTGGTVTPEGVKAIPAAAVSTLGAERIAAHLARGVVRLKLELSCQTLPDKKSYNVVGELTGREYPKEVVIIGGHLDSWDVGQGAHDCGAGVTQTIEALRLLKALDLRPRRTLRVVAFMNEENGTRGARAYAAEHKAELGDLVMALESDRGGFTPRGFTTDANPSAKAILQTLAGLLKGSGADMVIEGYGGADISKLKGAGAIMVGYLPDSQRYFDLHHTRIDTFDTVHWRELELGTAAIASLAYAVADLPERLPANDVKPRDGD